ncbi:hypothetical protein [Dinghuibacter silviterrae]|uniref:Uncharacterized protein n=1 Tax=Dinghuibacter silviterrae TaxID=1539049 RepID=A0A4R8DHP9_9BACT|nr:hypothetical protein [Dinghuibacter silviterrae]TDW97065.1 hypothetical protein EDB95_4904 [Dinghuibacter silviterrae]
MYYVIKVANNWTLVDATNGNSTKLDPPQVDCLSILFPRLLTDTSTVVTGVQVSLLQPNKMMQLPMQQKPPAPRKVLDGGQKA